jgi:hypothetical protein
MATRPPVLALVALLLPVASVAQGLVPFGPEFQVNTHTTGGQQYAVPAIAPDGTFVVVWDSWNDGRGDGVFAQRYDASGLPVGVEFRVNVHTGVAARADVVSDIHGGFMVVWCGLGEDGRSDIYARRFDSSGMPLGAEVVVNTYTTRSENEPSIAMDAAGRAVIVWEAGHTDEPPGVFARRYAVDGQPDGDEFQVSTSTAGPHHHATVASDAAGNFMVTWEVWTRDLDISARRFDAQGLAQTPTFRVNTHATATQSDAFVSSNPNGNFVVVWGAQLDGWPRMHVAAQRYDPSGTPAGLEFRVNSITTSYGLHPYASVAVDPAGGFTAVWHWNDDGNGLDVVGQHFDASGSPVGDQFQVNVDTAGNHRIPFIAAGPQGDFLVTWTAAPSAGSADIRARWYRPDVIFADGFESGSFSAWSSSATGGGDLTVSPDAAAKLTTHGLSGAVNDTAALFVQDGSPRDEPRYRARFHFDTNGFDPGEAESHLRTRVFIVFEEAPTRRLAAIVLRRQDGAYSLIGRARLDDGTQADTAGLPIGDGEHFVEIDWRRSSGPDANDGSFEMWIDGTPMATLSNLDNSLSAVDFVRLGALSVKSGAAGTMYWDEFESRRGSYIGP